MMKNVFLLAALLLALTSCKKESLESSLSPENKAVYNMLWGKTFKYEGIANTITFDDTIEFLDVAGGNTMVSFKVKSVEDFQTSPSDLTQGVGVLFSGDNYSVEAFLKDGTENYIIIHCFLGSEERMSMIVTP